ncbi:MAG: hypothetical protein Q9159_000882 [Coniocarpon cinnabarinum]
MPMDEQEYKKEREWFHEQCLEIMRTHSKYNELGRNIEGYDNVLAVREKFGPEDHQTPEMVDEERDEMDDYTEEDELGQEALKTKVKTIHRDMAKKIVELEARGDDLSQEQKNGLIAVFKPFIGHYVFG